MELFFFKLIYLSGSYASFKQKFSCGHVTKTPRDDGLLSEPTTEVNGNQECDKLVELVSKSMQNKYM